MVNAQRIVNWFWITMAAGNILWDVLPHLMMLMKSHEDEPGVNISTATPTSRLVHRPFPEERRLELREDARRMFYWGYDNYINHAFPQDELNPIDCSGRGHDWTNPLNLNVNDVLGDYSLTLVDTLDTLAVMGDTDEFKRAVELVIENVSFDHCPTVQVFEASIRMIGSLVSAHLLITDPDQPFGSLAPDNYSNELLLLAHDLSARLLPAFENTSTGLPHPRVNLCDGVPPHGILESCTAGAGSLLVEFGLLSRLLGDPVYENLARRAVRALWDRRHSRTGLLGNVVHLNTGEWVGAMSGLGAGLDSFYEYLLKAYILYGEREDLEMFNSLYQSIMTYLRKGDSCQFLMNAKSGKLQPPLFVNVDYSSGKLLNHWIDSLSASFSGVQVLVGDVKEAICTHALYYSIWRRYGLLPERFDWRAKYPVLPFYPLRPELVESTYLLYQATRNPFYLHVGSDILASLEAHTKTRCGYATVHDVESKKLEDRMESFFLSETCKYLYLLFDTDNIVNKQSSEFLFTTEGHILRLGSKLWPTSLDPYCRPSNISCRLSLSDSDKAVAKVNESLTSSSCPAFDTPLQKHLLPLSKEMLGAIEYFVGLHTRTDHQEQNT